MESVALITCEVCGRQFKQLTVKHLKTHDLTLQTYLEHYPYADTISAPRTAWNKGIAMSQEQKQHLSNIRKQRYASGEIVHWNRGKTTSDSTKKKISRTLLSQNRTYSDESKQKRTETYRIKKEDGWQHFWSTEEGKRKNKEIFLLHHGVDNPLKSHAVQQKIKDTCIEKYGVDNPLKSQEVRKRLEQYWKDRAQVTNPMATKDVWVKRMFNSPANTISIVQLKHAYDLLSNKEWLIEQHHTQNKTLVEIGDSLGLLYHSIGWFLRKHDIEIKYYFSSRLQKEISSFIENNCHASVAENARNIITPHEIDIFLPANKLGIEINGIYWHSEIAGTPRLYHLIKTKKAQEAGIRLIHIFENEWMQKQQIVKSRLKSILGCADRIPARSCIIREIDNQQSSIFLEKNHMQGNTAASIKLGLFFNNKLVSVMTFGRSRFATNSEHELLRFATIHDTVIVGGASKLFKHFIDKYAPTSIVSYSDNRWNTGNLYVKLGFTCTHNTSPNYFYFNLPDVTLHNRIKFQKHKLPNLLEHFDPNLTEWENMKNNGWNRIWDCGNSVWFWSVQHSVS